MGQITSTPPAPNRASRILLITLAAAALTVAGLLFAWRFIASLPLRKAARVETVGRHWLLADPGPAASDGSGAGTTLWRRDLFGSRAIRPRVNFAKDVGDDCVLYSSTRQGREDYFCACGARRPLLFASLTPGHWQVAPDSLMQQRGLLMREGKLLRQVDRIRLAGVKTAALAGPATILPNPEWDSRTFNPEADFVSIAVTPETLASALVETTGLDSVESMLALLARGADVNRGVPPLGDTPLMHAVSAGAARILLRSGARIDQQNAAGDTALMLAARHGRIEVVKFLLQQGADATIRNRAGQTAASSDVRLAGGLAADGTLPLLAGVPQPSFEPHSSEACTELISRIVGGRIDLAVQSLNAGVDVNCHNAEGNSPLVEASRHPLPPTVALFLLGHGANINGTDFAGTTPLMAAADAALPRNVEALLAAGASTTATDASGRDALAIATTRGNPEVISLLSRAAVPPVPRP